MVQVVSRVSCNSEHAGTVSEVSVLVALSALLRSVAVASVLIVVVCLRYWDLPLACVWVLCAVAMFSVSDLVEQLILCMNSCVDSCRVLSSFLLLPFLLRLR